MAAQAIDGLAFPDEKKKYIVEVLDPILEQMVQSLLSQVPENPNDFMMDWLRKRGKINPAIPSKMALKEQSAKLKKELASLQEFVDGATLAAGGKEKAEEEKPAVAEKAKADDSEEEEDDDDEAPDMPMLPPPGANRGQRASVSAEAYGNWNQVREFTPPKHEKTAEQTSKLREILSSSFMFSALEAKDLDIVLLAMVEKTFEAGARIITEGEDGEHLYVIEEGSPVCKKDINGEQKVVKTCVPGDVFGELALLYNCPRAATVEAVDECRTWQLDRETFSHIVKDAATRRSAEHDGFLCKVGWFMEMEKYERSQICDALKQAHFKKDDIVVKQNDHGDTFYIVEEGELRALKEDKEVMEYKCGDYFGELALLKDQPRAATIKVISDAAKLLCLDRKCFTKMLGPLSDILARKEYA